MLVVLARGASAQNAETNVVTASADAFGVAIGVEALGVYGPSQVRGFDPLAAGNARIARTTVLSDNAFSVMVPVLHQILAWRTGAIRELLESNGLTLEAWDRARTDRVQIGDGLASAPAT